MVLGRARWVVGVGAVTLQVMRLGLSQQFHSPSNTRSQPQFPHGYDLSHDAGLDPVATGVSIFYE